MVASLFVAGRMANLDEDAQTLFAAYRLTWNAIVERPLTGHVYGTFELMFPPIRDLSVSGSQTWNYAHNAYLETMAGLGVPAALTLMLSFLAPLLTCAGAILRPRRDLGATRVAVAAFLALGLHSLVDFSIQMQAISIAAFALLGAGLARTA
jgi:O-antigen ligase